MNASQSVPAARIDIPVPGGCAACVVLGEEVERASGRLAAIRWRSTEVRTPCGQHTTLRAVVHGSYGTVEVSITSDGFATPHDDAVANLFECFYALDRSFSAAAERAVVALSRLPLLVGDGTDIADALLWVLARACSREQVRQAEGLGLDAQTASDWMCLIGEDSPGHRRDGLRTLPELLGWWAAAKDPDRVLSMADVGPWLSLGFRDPATLPAGLSADDVIILRFADLPLDRAWAGAGLLCPNFLRLGATMGRRPEDVMALGGALVTGSQHVLDCAHRDLSWSTCQWDAHDALRAVKDASTTLADVDWADAAVCLRAGMSVDEAADYLRAGAEMAPVRLMAAMA